jgi:predicted nucleic acid-binding protein
MILLDTSIWIEFLNGRIKKPGPDDFVQFTTAGPIIQEVFQGLRPGPASEAFREIFLALPRLSDPLPLELFLEAADFYREGRRRGNTIRSSTDCLIAAIAIKHQLPVWHRDRDFDAIAKFTRLSVFRAR